MKWTEREVSALLGQSENLRLEFKSGALFNSPENEWWKTLSREISAFANTEGGNLILGVREGKKDARGVAEEIDGVPASIDPQQFQQKA